MSLSIQEIDELGKRMDKDVRAIKEELIKICWWMRGGISLNEAAQLTYNDRLVIADLIKENLETTNRTRLPFF
jgi:hypothetical protein